MFQLQGSFERNGLMFEKNTKISVITVRISMSVCRRVAMTFETLMIDESEIEGRFDPVLGYYILPADDEDEGYYDI